MGSERLAVSVLTRAAPGKDMAPKKPAKAGDASAESMALGTAISQPEVLLLKKWREMFAAYLRGNNGEKAKKDLSAELEVQQNNHASDAVKRLAGLCRLRLAMEEDKAKNDRTEAIRIQKELKAFAEPSDGAPRSLYAAVLWGHHMRRLAQVIPVTAAAADRALTDMLKLEPSSWIDPADESLAGAKPPEGKPVKLKVEPLAGEAYAGATPLDRIKDGLKILKALKNAIEKDGKQAVKVEEIIRTKHEAVEKASCSCGWRASACSAQHLFIRSTPGCQRLKL